MLSASNRTISHDKISELMDKLGYKSVKKGICNGLAQMWVQAVLCHDTHRFIDRLYFICNEPELLQLIQRAQKKKGLNLSKKEEQCINVLAFFDGIQLYQNFLDFIYLIKQPSARLNTAAISSLTLPIKLSHTALLEIYTENRLFTLETLNTYLTQLASILILHYNTSAIMGSACGQSKLVICLHSCIHKIALTFHPETTGSPCWRITDANYLPPYDLPCNQISTAIKILLSLDSLITPINISIYTTHDNPLAITMQKSLSYFKKRYHITTKAAHTLSENNHHLLQLTAMRGDKSRFIKTAKKINNLALREYMLSAVCTALFHGESDIVLFASRHYSDCLLNSSEVQDYLSIAITTHQNCLIKIFLSHNADVNAKDNYGNYPLQLAVEANNFKALQILISQGANINQVNSRYESALIIAIKLFHHAITNYLASSKGIDLNLRDNMGDSALIIAIKYSSVRACETLLRYGASVNSKNYSNESPAHIACMANNLACLDLLTRYKVDLTSLDFVSRSPIFITIINQYFNLTAHLLLHLPSLNNLNSFSLLIIIKHAQAIVASMVELIKPLSIQRKLDIWDKTQQQRNAIGKLLGKNSYSNHFNFFKSKERKEYLHQLRSATKCTSSIKKITYPVCRE